MTLEDLVEWCLSASRGVGGAEAVREVVRGVISRSDELDAVLGPVTVAGETTLFSSPELTVARLVWGPRMVMYPHDHRMWAVIGVYRGAERNILHRRSGNALATAGIVEIGAGEVAVLDPDVIHSVVNPFEDLSAAIHVFGGDFVHQPRSEWDWKTLTERPYDDEHVRRLFAAANASAAHPEPDSVEGAATIGGFP
jgi:predicted metal-dependent enzyme (double-stranded beta helix superfamily)